MTLTRIVRPITLLLLVGGLTSDPAGLSPRTEYGRAYRPAPYGSSLPGYPSANYFSRTRAIPVCRVVLKQLQISGLSSGP